MSRGGGGAAGVVILIPLILIGFVGFYVFFQLPLNPTLTVTFKVSTTASSITVNSTLNSTFYSKSTLAGSSGVPQGQILLSRLGSVMNGSDILSIVIRYGPNNLSSGNFTSIGDGAYRVRILYGMRSENSSVPYTVILALYSPGYFLLTNSTATLYPS